MMSLRVELRGTLVELHVRDDGPGFATDIIDTAFERFTRADAERSREAPGWDWRSSPRSQTRTGETPARATDRGAGRTSGSPFRACRLRSPRQTRDEVDRSPPDRLRCVT